MAHDIYDVAEVCPNGHLSNERAGTEPDYNKPRCERCGEKTMQACPSCHKPIRGAMIDSGGVGTWDWRPPAYCLHCGAAFPWTERAIQAATDLVALSVLTEQEQAQFAADVQAIAADTPLAKPAGFRLLAMFKKMGEGIGSVARDIVVDVAAEAVKRSVFKDPPAP